MLSPVGNQLDDSEDSDCRQSESAYGPECAAPLSLPTSTAAAQRSDDVWCHYSRHQQNDDGAIQAYDRSADKANDQQREAGEQNHPMLRDHAPQALRRFVEVEPVDHTAILACMLNKNTAVCEN